MLCRKYTTLQLFGMLLLLIAIPMAAIVSLTRAQEKSNDLKPESRSVAATQGSLDKPCTAPRSEFEGWLRMRSLPVRFTEIDGDTVYWKFEGRGGIHLGSLILTKGSRFFDNELKEKDRLYFEANLTNGEFGINFDSECFILFSATKIKP